MSHHVFSSQASFEQAYVDDQRAVYANITQRQEGSIRKDEQADSRTPGGSPLFSPAAPEKKFPFAWCATKQGHKYCPKCQYEGCGRR